MDETDFVVLGGDSDPITERVAAGFKQAMSSAEALEVARTALAGDDRTLENDDLEIAMLDRTRGRRTFTRWEP